MPMVCKNRKLAYIVNDALNSWVNNDKTSELISYAVAEVQMNLTNHAIKEHVFVDGVEYKVCSRCDSPLPLSSFSKDRSKHDGLHGFCKECTNKINANTYESNPEVKRKKSSAYSKTENGRVTLRASAMKRRKAIDETSETPITRACISRIVEMYNGSCAYCGNDCKSNYHIDHKIPLSRGGKNIFENLALSCPKCNLTKHVKTDVEFCGHEV